MPTDNDRKRLRALASAVDSAENKGGGWWVVNACHLATGVLSLLDQLEAVERERDAARWADETRKKAAQALVLENSRLVDVDIQLACAKQSLAQQDAQLAASQQETERLRALLGEACDSWQRLAEHRLHMLRHVEATAEDDSILADAQEQIRQSIDELEHLARIRAEATSKEGR